MRAGEKEDAADVEKKIGRCATFCGILRYNMNKI